MRARQVAVPALEVVVESLEVPVAEPAAALPVQTAVDRAVPAAVLAPASVAAQAAGQVPVLLRVEAPQQGPGRVLLVDRELSPVGRALAPAAGRAVIQVAAPELALVVVQAPSAERELAPVVPVSALPAALQVVRPEA
jgi:hypothetical protein